MGGDVRPPKEPPGAAITVEVNQARDPIDVFRAAIAERARLQELFREAKLTGGEVARLLRAMAAARGLDGYWTGKDQRALQLLLDGRPDWYKGLLNDPETIPASLREALEQRAAVPR
jgi:hypothetical protein